MHRNKFVLIERKLLKQRVIYSHLVHHKRVDSIVMMYTYRGVFVCLLLLQALCLHHCLRLHRFARTLQPDANTFTTSRLQRTSQQCLNHHIVSMRMQGDDKIGSNSDLYASSSTGWHKRILKTILLPILPWIPFHVDPSLAYPLPECSDSIVVLRQRSNQGSSGDLRQIAMIGTAHISEDSANLVHRTIQTIKPDTIMIELDPKRVGRADKAMSVDQLAEAGYILPRFSASDASETVSVGSITGGVAGGMGTSSSATITAPATSFAQPPINKKPSLFERFRTSVVNNIQQLAGKALGKALGQFYNSVEQLGFTAGGEFKAAVEESRAIGAKVLLGDRDVDITLRRLALAISADSDKLNSVMEKLAVVEEQLGLPADSDAITNKEQMSEFVEGIKQKETINQIMGVIKVELPDIYNALVGERDQYMSSAIAQADSQNLVGVVGLAHMQGIVNYLQQAGFEVVDHCSIPSNK